MYILHSKDIHHEIFINIVKFTNGGKAYLLIYPLQHFRQLPGLYMAYTFF